MNKLNMFFSKEISFIPPFALSVSINIFLFALFFSFITPGFETNDDAFFMMFSSGMINGEPSECLILINVILGKLLKTLYIHLPSISWYPLFLYAMHFFGMVILLYVYLAMRKSFFSILYFLIQFIFFQLFFLTKIQFSTAAFTIGFCGTVLFFYSFDNSLKYKWLTIIAAFLSILLAGLTRWHVFYGLLLIWIPVLAIAFLKGERLKITAFFCTLLIFFSALYFYHKHYYEKTLEMPNFFRYWQAMDYLPNGPLTTNNELIDKSLAKVGWKINDLELIKRWFWIDDNVFTSEKAIFVGHELRSYRKLNEALRLLFYEIFFKSKRYTFFNFICFLLILILLPKNQIKYILVLLATVFIILLTLSFLSRIPQRVHLTLAYFICIFGFYLVIKHCNEGLIKKGVSFCLVLLFTVLFVFQLVKIIHISELNKAGNQYFEDIVHDIKSDKNSLFVISGTNFPYEHIPIFANPLHNRPLNILPTCWTINTPVYKRILEIFYIDNLINAIHQKDNVYILEVHGQPDIWQPITLYDETSIKYGADVLLKQLKNGVFINERSITSVLSPLKIFYQDHYGLNVEIQHIKKNFTHIKPVRVILY